MKYKTNNKYLKQKLGNIYIVNSAQLGKPLLPPAKNKNNKNLNISM